MITNQKRRERREKGGKGRKKGACLFCSAISRHAGFSGEERKRKRGRKKKTHTTLLCD